MKITKNITDKMDHQIAHIMASYADEPRLFMAKINELLVEWFCKGLTSGIETERAHKNGKQLTCPYCQHSATIYHLEWTAVCCPNCRSEIKRDEMNV